MEVGGEGRAVFIMQLLSFWETWVEVWRGVC